MTDLQSEFVSARAACIAAAERLATARDAMRAAGLDARARTSVRVMAQGVRHDLDEFHSETFVAIASAPNGRGRGPDGLHPTEVLNLRNAGLVRNVWPDRWIVAPGVELESAAVV